MRWTLVRFIGAFVGEFVGVVISLISATAGVIFIGQFAGFLPGHIVVTLPALPFPGNPLWRVALLVAAIAFTVGGILLWARSVATARSAHGVVIERDEAVIAEAPSPRSE